jgi:hypothetical protein
MIADPTVQAANETLVRGLTSDDNTAVKEASGLITDHLRIRVRENGILRSVFELDNITPADLDRTGNTEDAVKWIDIEPNSAGARTVAFAGGPANRTIRAGRYPLFFREIETDRYQAHKLKLMTWTIDLRTMYEELLMKDIQDTEDNSLINALNSTCGALNAVNVELGNVRRYVSLGALNRASWMEARKGLGVTNRHLNAKVGIMNNVSMWDIPALPREEIGGNLAQDLFVEGNTMTKIGGLPMVFTNKHELVHDDELYQLADPSFIGNFACLEDITVHHNAEDKNIEFYGTEYIGFAIRNIAGVCRSIFNGTATSWRG